MNIFLDEEEDNIIMEYKEKNNIRSKEQAIKNIIREKDNDN